MGFDLGSLLQQYAGGVQNANTAQVEEDFHQVAQAAPADVLSSGVAEALRSDQTPPFSTMVGQLFGNGNSQQRAGMLNQLIGGLSPSILASLGGGLGGLFGGGQSNASTIPNITPEQASRLDPAQIQQVAERAEQQDPSIIDRMGSFYAAHPNLVKTLGGAALAIVMNKVSQRMRPI